MPTNVITDMKGLLSDYLFNLANQQNVRSVVDLYVCTTKAVKLAHKVCNECENG
jgi:hypothetical protein